MKRRFTKSERNNAFMFGVALGMLIMSIVMILKG